MDARVFTKQMTTQVWDAADVGNYGGNGRTHDAQEVNQHKIEQDVVKTAEVEGDSLDSILNSAEKNSGENLQDEAPEVPKAPNVGAVKEKKGDSLNDIK